MGFFEYKEFHHKSRRICFDSFHCKDPYQVQDKPGSHMSPMIWRVIVSNHSRRKLKGFYS